MADIESKLVTEGLPYGKLPIPTRPSYAFEGWYTAESNGTLITEETIANLTANQTLYAHWTFKTSYSVTLNANGGSVTPTSKSVMNNQVYGEFPAPIRAGYTFVGWYTASSGGVEVTAETIVNLTEDQTLFAQWQSNPTPTPNPNPNTNPTPGPDRRLPNTASADSVTPCAVLFTLSCLCAASMFTVRKKYREAENGKR